MIFLSFFMLSILSLYIVYLHNGHLLIGDDYHFHQNRIEGLAASIKHGNWLPKVSYYFIGGYGYASSLFYPDFYLYFPAILRLLGLSLSASFIIFAVGINFGTFVLTYISGRYLDLSKTKSYLFSLLYTLSIYRLQDFFNRQALGELLAISFFPLVFASLYLLKNGKEHKWLLLVGAMCGIGLAHFISLEIISLFIGFYMLLNWKSFFKKQPLLALAKATVLTIGLLSFYLAPIMEQMTHTTFQVSSNPLTLISERSYSLSELLSHSFKNSVFHASSANIGIILLMGLVAYSLTLFKKVAPNRDLILLSLLFMYMTTNYFPWKLLNHTPLNTIQFPWRLLSLVTLLLAYLIADDSLGFLKKIPKALPLLILFIFLGVAIYETESVITGGKRVMTYEKYNHTNSYYIGAGHEYLPEETDYSVILKQKKRKLTYDENQIKVMHTDMTFDKISFDFQTQQKQAVDVTLPFIYYYGYQARILTDGKEETKPVSMDRKNGLVKVRLTGRGKVSVSYQMTAVQKASLGFSTIVFVLLILAKINTFRIKKQLFLYKNDGK
ncbi:hypothetical protein GIX45_17935 [Erwinia sp. CPCC 100877]|nr:hypothetical protein [Erwinia sp. CPCC 100877]